MNQVGEIDITIDEIVSNQAAHNFILNVYRYNENTRALRLSKFTELVRDPELKILVAKHFFDESKHAFLFTRHLLELGADIYPLPPEMDYLYKLESSGIGVSFERMLDSDELTDDEIVRFLVADELLEERGVKTLSQHLDAVTESKTRSLIDAILRDEKNHVSYINQAIETLSSSRLKDRISDLYSEYRARETAISQNHWQILQHRLIEFF